MGKLFEWLKSQTSFKHQFSNNSTNRFTTSFQLTITHSKTLSLIQRESIQWVKLTIRNPPCPHSWARSQLFGEKIFTSHVGRPFVCYGHVSGLCCFQAEACEASEKILQLSFDYESSTTCDAPVDTLEVGTLLLCTKPWQQPNFMLPRAIRLRVITVALCQCQRLI